MQYHQFLGIFWYSYNIVSLNQEYLKDLNDRLIDQEERNSELTKARKRLEQDVEHTRKAIADLELSVKKLESEKVTKDNHIKSLQDEMMQQDEVFKKNQFIAINIESNSTGRLLDISDSSFVIS